MNRTIYQAMRRLFAALLILNTLMICIIIYLAETSYTTQRNALIDMGKTVLRAFEASRPMIFNVRNGNEHLSQLLDEMFDLETISNLVIYQDDGSVIFSLHPPKGIIRTELHDRYEEETPDDIILYNSFHPTMGGMGMGRRMMGNNMQNQPHEGHQMTSDKVFIAIAINKSALNNFRQSTYITFAVSLIIEILILFLYFRIKQVVALYEQSVVKLKNAEKEAATGRLSSILAHEIKNPLSSMSGLISYALKKNLDEQTEDLLVRTQDEILRLSTIVNDFLAYGRTFELELTDKDVKKLLLKTCELMQHDAALKSIKLTITGDTFTAFLDENKILQVLVNLILNAIDASPSGSQIGIDINKNLKLITVTNETSKPVAGDIDKIFEPFYTTKTKGSGLGLSITKRIVEQHGYDISVITLNPFSVQIKFQQDKNLI